MEQDGQIQLNPTPDRPPEPHLIGYARVSMNDQTNQRQIDELVRFGVDRLDIYTDSASGRSMKRPGWRACLKDLRAGDILVIASVDRLGRDLVDLVQTIRDLRARGVQVKAMNMDIDTTTPGGMLIFQIIAAMAEWERRMIVERTRSGLRAAKERGKVGGAKPKNTAEDYLKARRRIDHGEDGQVVAKSLPRPTTRSGLYKAFDRLRKEGRL